MIDYRLPNLSFIWYQNRTKNNIMELPLISHNIVWNYFFFSFIISPFLKYKFWFENVGEKWDTLLHAPLIHHSDRVHWDTLNHSIHDWTNPMTPHMFASAFWRFYRLATCRQCRSRHRHRRRQPPAATSERAGHAYSPIEHEITHDALNHFIANMNYFK